MAKVTTLKFQIKGVDYSVNVNCTSTGEFTASLPFEVSRDLSLRQKLTANSLAELRSEFHNAINRYKEAETSKEYFIAIKYKASGRYAEDEGGRPLFGGYSNDYNFHNSFDTIQGVGFTFMVCIKQTKDSVVTWFATNIQGEGNTILHPELKFIEHPIDDYVKSTTLSSPEKWKKIPYSAEALRTLNHAQENIRKISHLLFLFIEQDESKMVAMLNNNKLLGDGN